METVDARREVADGFAYNLAIGGSVRGAVTGLARTLTKRLCARPSYIADDRLGDALRLGEGERRVGGGHYLPSSASEIVTGWPFWVMKTDSI